MATNERFMPLAAETIWDALTDPGGYGYWVVGSKFIRDVDDDWPAVGSSFHHKVGVGPLTINDHSQIVESERPRLFRMRVKARPAGTAIVSLRMEPRPADGGTLVRFSENPDGVFAWLSLNPATHLFTLARNAESLARLEELALIQAEREGRPVHADPGKTKRASS